MRGEKNVSENDTLGLDQGQQSVKPRLYDRILSCQEVPVRLLHQFRACIQDEPGRQFSHFSGVTQAMLKEGSIIILKILCQYPATG